MPIQTISTTQTIRHPGGGYHKTDKGWSKLEEKEKKDGKGTVPTGMTDEQKDLEKRALSKSEYEVYRAVQNTKISPKTLTKVFKKETKKSPMEWNTDILSDVAENPNASPQILSRLGTCPHKEIRRSVSGNHNSNRNSCRVGTLEQ